MNEAEKKRLRSILNRLDALKREIEDLLGVDESPSPHAIGTSGDVTRLVANINLLSSTELETRLEGLSHKDLGDVFVAIGGASGDKRKQKAWLMERILWLSKEFAEGHRAIRES
jgi:hypothetical protein